MSDLRVHEGVPRGTLAGEWELLMDEDPHATVFHGPRYLAVWHETLGARVTARTYTLHREGRLVGVVPEAHEREGSATGPVEVRRYLGGTEVTDYLGPVSRREDRVDVATAYLELLADDVDWDEVVLGGLHADSGWPDAFRVAAGGNGLTIAHDDVEDVCPRVNLAGGYDAYLEALPGRLRQELHRKTRKLARDAGDLEVVEVPGGEVLDQLDDFLDQAGEAEPDKAGFFTRPEIHDWFKALAAEFAEDGIFRLHRLLAGGLPAAATVSLVWRGHWGLYNSSFDPTLAALSPGIVLKGRLIEVAAGEGCEVYDLLRGSEPYKYRFGATDAPLHRLTIVRS